MPASSTPQVYETNAALEQLTEAFPVWRTGTGVLRDAAGKICGTFWFKRVEGGFEMSVGPASPGEEGWMGSRVGDDETRF